jgi:Geminivirus Rep catalytic domain
MSSSSLSYASSLSSFRLSAPSTTSSSSRLPHRRTRRHEIAHSWLFITYSQSTLHDKSEFIEQFELMLQRNSFPRTYYFGARELHADEGIHYHVILGFGQRKRMSFKTARHLLNVSSRSDEAINFSPMKTGQSSRQYVSNCIGYCEKQGDVFGHIPSHYLVSGDRYHREQQRWNEIGQQDTLESKLAMVKHYFPKDYYKSFNGLMSACRFEHPAEESSSEPLPYQWPSYIRPEWFVIPPLIQTWMNDNLWFPPHERPKSLIIIGRSRTGKSWLARHLAYQVGPFSEFETEWSIEGYRSDHRCAVFHDLKKDFPYWKDVLGSQNYFSAHARYKPERRLRWGVPSIWVCNPQQDPRLFSTEHAYFIEDNCVVYEVTEPLYRPPPDPPTEAMPLFVPGGPSSAGGAKPDTLHISRSTDEIVDWMDLLTFPNPDSS